MAFLLDGLRRRLARPLLASIRPPVGLAKTAAGRPGLRRLSLEPLEGRMLLSIQPFSGLPGSGLPGEDVEAFSAVPAVMQVEEAARGTIHGVVWDDLDADGARDDGEPELVDWKVYLDVDLSGGWEDGEPFERTGPDGSYAFTGLASGTYTVAEELPSGWLQTFPATGAQTEPPEAPADADTSLAAAGASAAEGSMAAAIPGTDHDTAGDPLLEWSVPDCLELPPEALAELEAAVQFEASAAPELSAVMEIAGAPPAGEAPYGADFRDTSEYMIGDVWVTVVLMESDGSIDPSTEDWTAETIDQVKTEIEEGFDWWEDMLSIAPAVPSRHELNFHVDFTYADNPVPTGYEPIDQTQDDEDLWINDFLDHVDHNSPGSYLNDVRRFNHDRRLEHGTHWALTVFVANSVNDVNGKFSDGYFAYAYVGGPFLVMTYDNNGWGISNMGKVLAHETGHVFYALDEYAGAHTYTDHSGYYNTQNLNAVTGHPDPDSRVDSIMAEAALQSAAYAGYTSSPSSLEMIGWKDSDADGIFDVLDVPLQLTGSGSHDAAENRYDFSGTSSVQTLPNENPKGQQNDITINTVDRIQYKLDDGDWIDGNTYGDYSVDVTQEVPTTTATYEIHFRTVVGQTGLTSAVWSDTIGLLPGTHTVELAADETEENVDFGVHHAEAAVVGRHVFYNNSSFDGDDPAPNVADDAAIAVDKEALLPGGVASLANYTSYSRGINGIMVDVDELPDGITPEAGLFEFRVGNGNDPSTWTPAPVPSTVTVREDAGADGSDRVTVIWADHDVRGQWLEVTMPAANFALMEGDVFYFGNAVAEAGNSTSEAQVSTTDLLLARNNPRNFLIPAEIDFPYDYDRDGRVNATDVLLARNNQTNFLSRLELIDLSPPEQAASDGEPLPSPAPAEALSQPAIGADAWTGQAAWFYEFGRTHLTQRPAKSHVPAARALDMLLAADHSARRTGRDPVPG